MLLIETRDRLSGYIYRLSREVTDSHLNAYASIKTLGIDTREELENLNPAPEDEECVNRILRRWEVQILRYGHRLASCIGTANVLLHQWNSQLNDIHATAHRTSNQVQNVGLSVLGDTDIFTGRDSLGFLINRRFRQLLARANAYRVNIDRIVDSISGDFLETIVNFERCDLDLVEEFQREIENDLARGRACVGISSAEHIDPVPTN